jgi:F0F1-type ATP synthase membrane subunit c/vacuolar-type H+-ATPase subunit K
MCLIGFVAGLLMDLICCAYANGKIMLATTKAATKNKETVIPTTNRNLFLTIVLALLVRNDEDCVLAALVILLSIHKEIMSKI